MRSMRGKREGDEHGSSRIEKEHKDAKSEMLCTLMREKWKMSVARAEEDRRGQE